MLYFSSVVHINSLLLFIVVADVHKSHNELWVYNVLLIISIIIEIENKLSVKYIGWWHKVYVENS